MSLAKARALLVVAGLVSAILITRMHVQPVQPYGSNGAEWIEHAARLEVLQAWQRGGDAVERIQAVDAAVGTHPPGLHLLTLLAGQSAEEVLWTGLLWLGLLSLGLGLTAHALAPGTGWLAAAGGLLLPAAHAAATRVHYDLPVAALTWLALGLLLLARKRTAWAVAAGAILGLAVLIKYSGLALGLMAIGATALEPGAPVRRRLRLAALALGPMVLIVAGWQLCSDVSWHGGMQAVGDPDRPHDGASLAYILGQLDPRRLAPRLLWLPAATALSCLSPLGVLVLGAGWRRWLGASPPTVGAGRSRPGAALIGALIAGHLLLYGAIVVPLDERFLLSLLPALALPAFLARPSPRAVTVGLALGLLVAAEFHLSPVLTGTAWGSEPGLRMRGPFLADSTERRGWSSRATTPDPQMAAHRELGAWLDACAPTLLGTVHGIGRSGDTFWLRYRRRLAQVRGPAADLTVLARPQLGAVSFWWPDADTRAGGGDFSALGFDRRRDDVALRPQAGEAEVETELGRLGMDPAALRLFEPSFVLAREGVPHTLGPLWTPVLRLQDSPVLVLGRGDGCPGRAGPPLPGDRR